MKRKLKMIGIKRKGEKKFTITIDPSVKDVKKK